MDVDDRFLTLLTPEGEFLKARKQKQDYFIGEEIVFFPIIENKKNKSLFFNFFPGKALTAATAAVFIASATFIPFYNSNQVYAYMSIDVNPSIELAVNDDLEVIELEAFNPEGKQIISEIKDWKKRNVTTVTSDILAEIKEQGFFQNHDKVVISTVNSEKKELKVEKKLEANIEEIEEKIEQENLQLTVVHATKEERKAAHDQGVTIGAYKATHREVNKKVEDKKKKTEVNPNNNKKDSNKIDGKSNKNNLNDKKNDHDKNEEKKENRKNHDQIKKNENKIREKGKEKKKKDEEETKKKINALPLKNKNRDKLDNNDDDKDNESLYKDVSKKGKNKKNYNHKKQNKNKNKND